MAAPSTRRVHWDRPPPETGDALVAQFERNAAGAFAPLRLAPLGRQSFSGVFATRRLGDITVSRIRASAYQVSRLAPLIGSGDPELVKVQVQHRGAARVEQGGRQSVTGPGSVVAYGTTDPYRVAFDGDNEVTVIGIPRGRLGAYADRIRVETAVALPPFAPFLHTVGGLFSLPVPPPADDVASTSLGDALVSLLVAGLGSAAAESAVESSGGRRILAYCAAHLGDPRLGAAHLARVFAVSERQVYKLVAAEGVQLASWIRRRRLEGIRDDLADPLLADAELGAIVREWGIADVTHISRALRAEFGVTAAELRESAATPALSPVLRTSTTEGHA